MRCAKSRVVHIERRLVRRRNERIWKFSLILIGIFVSLATGTSAHGQSDESFEGFISGIRANAVKGDVFYVRGEEEFALEYGHKLEPGDFIRTKSESYAELLLQPGCYLRLGSESELQLLSDPRDRMRLRLNHGAISLEILTKDGEDSFLLYESLSQIYELTRIITPSAEVFITRSGIFRINSFGAGRTDLIVRDGEAVINGRRVKEKRSGAASSRGVAITEINTKLEDSLDVWSRERADKLVQANRLLKHESPWAKNRNENEDNETSVDLPRDEDQSRRTHFVVSARPGAVNFVDAGVEVSRKLNNWEPLTEKLQLETGDKLRSGAHSYAELTMLPDINLRIDSKSEILFEQLANESISLKLLQGSAILDVARFEKNETPPIRLGGVSTSVWIADNGNYRLDVNPGGDEISVREGKVIFKERSVGSCRRIFAGTVSDCDKRGSDNFDFWSNYRGEGKLYNGRDVISMAAHLDRLRRIRSRNTGFWFQNPGTTQYTFVPFSSRRFRSPYGGSYSTVLSPRRAPIMRPNFGPRAPFGRVPGPSIVRP